MKSRSWISQWASKQANNYRGLFKASHTPDSSDLGAIEKQIKSLQKIEAQVRRNRQDGREIEIGIFLQAIEVKLKGELPQKTELKLIQTELKTLGRDYQNLRELQLPPKTKREIVTELGVQNRDSLEARFRALERKINNWGNATGLDLFE